jgi:TolA-binding protein
MIRRPCTDERVLRERRGQLAESERPAFNAHLTMCEWCRIDLAVGLAFDESDVPAVDDGVRIRRLVRAAEQWTKGGRVPRVSGAATLRRRTAVLAAACFLLVAGAATAELGGPRGVAAIVLRPFRRGAETPADPTTPRAPSRPARPAEPAAPPPAPLAEDDVAPPTPAAPSSMPHRALSAARTESAANLFGLANDARRSGDTRTASTLFRQLQHLFPESAEARLSRVSLGGLLLDDGRAGAALDQFDRAVAGGDATLRPEALYGRARALGALHRDGAEVLAWEQLLREFPSCPYADTARRRLDALSQ